MSKLNTPKQIGDAIKKALNGDQDAYRDLFNNFYKTVYNNAYKIIGNSFDADEVTAEVLTLVLNKLKHIKNPSALPFYMKRTAITRAINAVKANRRAQTIEFNEFVHTKTETESEPDYSIELNQIKNEVRKLNPLHKVIFLDYYYRNEMIQNIASNRKLKEGTVKRRLHTAREQIKSTLGAI